MIPIEQYAELCAQMADTGGDADKENAIAAQHGISAADWQASKAHWTAKMSDPSDMGKTAMAFMPLYQAAQAKARGGAEPCTLETYAKVHAGMALKKDAAGNKVDHQIVIAEHGFSPQQWLECEGYWTPKVGGQSMLGQDNPQFDAKLHQDFKVLYQKAADEVLGIVR